MLLLHKCFGSFTDSCWLFVVEILNGMIIALNGLGVAVLGYFDREALNAVLLSRLAVVFVGADVMSSLVSSLEWASVASG